MVNIKFLELDIDKIVIRFNVMMIGTLILGFVGYMTLAAIWGGVLAVSAILGVSFTLKKPTVISSIEEMEVLGTPTIVEHMAVS